MCFFLRIRRPPRSTRTDTLVPTRRSSDLRRLRSLGSRIMSRLRLLGGAALAVALGVGAWQGIEAMRSPGATPSPSTTPTSAVEQGTEAASDIVTIDTPRTAVSEAGATPMEQRVAVLGLLNKRNGESRDSTPNPGQAVGEHDRTWVRERGGQ